MTMLKQSRHHATWKSNKFLANIVINSLPPSILLSHGASTKLKTKLFIVRTWQTINHEIYVCCQNGTYGSPQRLQPSLSPNKSETKNLTNQTIFVWLLSYTLCHLVVFWSYTGMLNQAGRKHKSVLDAMLLNLGEVLEIFSVFLLDKFTLMIDIQDIYLRQ